MVRVVVPGRPPGANDLIRLGHWRIRAVRQEWKDRTVMAVREIGGVPGAPWSRAQVGVTWRCRLNRRRDFDNLVSGIKPLLDGLVEAGVLEDDSTDVLEILGPFRVEVGAKVDETILDIWQIRGRRQG